MGASLDDEPEGGQSITIDEFEARAEAERDHKRRCYARSAFIALMREVQPGLVYLDQITMDVMSRALAHAKDKGRSPATREGYLKHTMSALRWAKEIKLLSRVPEAPKVRIPTRTKPMRSRPITAEEYERLLAHTAKEAPKMVPVLQACYLGGLRIGECSILTRDWTQGFVCDLDHKPPVWRIQAECQKSNRDDVLPIPGDLVRYLRSKAWPKTGRMFRGVPRTPDTLSKKVRKLGAAVGIVVNADGKTVSAQDLRRSFGTRMARAGLTVSELQRVMRHSDIETTNSYYVDLHLDDLARKLATIGGDNASESATSVADICGAKGGAQKAEL